MSLVITVGGVDRTDWVPARGWSIHRTLGDAAATLRFNDDTEGGFRPTADDPVTVAIDGTTLFDGLLQEPDEAEVGDMIDVPASVAGYAVQSDWCRATWTHEASISLRDAFDCLITHHLGRYGWTRDPAMAEGPSVSGLSYTRATLREILNDLVRRAGNMVWTLKPGQVLTAFTPGTWPAPWDIEDSDADPKILADPPPRVRVMRQEYADRVVLVCGGTTAVTKTQTFHADGLPHRYEYFVTDYPTNPSSPIWPNVVVVEGYGPVPTAFGVIPGMPWCWDYDNHRMIHDEESDSYMGHLAEGTDVTFTYLAQFPFEVVSDAGSPSPREAYIDRPDIMSIEAGQTVADAYRTLLSRERHEIEYSTLEPGLEPGMTQTIERSRLGIVAAPFLVTEVEIDQVTGPILRYRVKAVEGAAYFGSALDAWRSLGGGGGGQSYGAAGGAGPALPARRYAGLGGSVSRRVVATGWQPVPDSTPKVLYASDYIDGIAFVHVWRATEHASDPVQVRVTAWNGATWTQVGAGASYDGTDIQAAAAHETFLVTVLNGAQHRLEVYHANAAYGVWAHGYVE